MEDSKIIDLYWERNQNAIPVTTEKYGHYCKKIAWNILYNEQDCEECLNDTWLRAWNRMPSERPEILSAFLGAITRNLSLDTYRKYHAKKRGNGEITCIYDEVCDGILNKKAINGNPEQTLEERELVSFLNVFLEELDMENRVIFVRRYWYCDSTKQIADRMQVSESKVKSSLFRTRNKLRIFLEKEGYQI